MGLNLLDEVKNKREIDVRNIILGDIEVLKIKDKEYGGSWKKRGGIGAFMMLARKFDRIENQIKWYSDSLIIEGPFHEIINRDKRQEGILDDIRDLRRYCWLVMEETNHISEEELKIRELSKKIKVFAWSHFKWMFSSNLESELESLKYDIFLVDPSNVRKLWRLLIGVDVLLLELNSNTQSP